MKPAVDFTGQKFGKLVVLGMVKTPDGKRTACFTECECGKTKVVLPENLKKGSTSSCGCLRGKHNIKHGKSNSSTYHSWVSMLQRCTNINDPNYEYYGKQGIAVCNEWYSFQKFLLDMGERPDNKTLDRKNCSGNYEPSNCRWATITEQNNNKRTVAVIEHDGRSNTLSGWAKELNIKHDTLYSLWRRKDFDFNKTLSHIDKNRSAYAS